MSAFRDMVEDDINNVFLNQDEFAQDHSVDGETVNCVIDSDDMVELSGGHKLGLSASTITIQAATGSLPPRKEEGQTLKVDGRLYTVVSWSEDMGMSNIVLRQARSSGGRRI